MKTCAVIVAAGKGLRMGPNIDKIFLPLAGAPVVTHTWKRFDALSIIEEIILVVREGMQPAFEQLKAEYKLSSKCRFVPGGKERQDSVWNGLCALAQDAEIVAIQDAARPCTDAQTILNTIEAARETGASVAAQPVVDTIKESADGALVSRTVDRSRLWAVQTPQCFRVEVIRRALSAVRERGLQVTDDTAACELIGQPVRLVPGVKPNPKVTRPEDIPYIEYLLKLEQA